MLTSVKIRNFKRFDEIEFELGEVVVLIGPNNSGKTTALQALALWDAGLKQWLAKRGMRETAYKRPGVTINRKDLIAIPTPSADLLWRDLHVRSVSRDKGKQKTANVRIDVTVSGITESVKWECGLEFDYANAESFYCRPLKTSHEFGNERMQIPKGVENLKVAYLPPMSGLAAVEPKLEEGRIDVLLGEGQTAQVLRNLCYQIFAEGKNWKELCEHVRLLFGTDLVEPEYIKARGEIAMSYKEQAGVRLDLANSGRGLQQTLLLLAHLYTNPGTVLLLDEPDAHLEVLRQRQIYQVITDLAKKQGSQIIAASHSEVVLNEAAGKDMVIAFVGIPHRIDDRGSQVLKSLKEIGYDQYAQAEQTGWVLYLEGSSDLAIIRALARKMGHKSKSYLERPFVHYVANQPSKAKDHYHALREARRDLKGLAIFDSISQILEEEPDLKMVKWSKREIENYLCVKNALLDFANGIPENDMFSVSEASHRRSVMEDCIRRMEQALDTMKKPSPWSNEIKASDDFLDPLFDNFYSSLGLENQLKKSNYHQLVDYLKIEDIPQEVIEKLDLIAQVAEGAQGDHNIT